MSAYDCIDKIDNALSYAPSPVLSWPERIRNFVGYIPGFSSLRIHRLTPLTQAPKNWLLKIRDEIERIEGTRIVLTTAEVDNITAKVRYEAELQDLITQISSYQATHQDLPEWTALLDYLKVELDILKKVFLTQEGPNPELISKFLTRCETLERSPFLLNPVNQTKMKELGLSMGICYGLVLSMVDSDFSPYINKQMPRLTLNRIIHDYQTNQNNRSKDQLKIKKEGLTRLYFCPSIRRQAEELYQLASHHPGEHLLVTLKSMTKQPTAHGVYLSIQSNGQIRYMEPNFGAFLFNTKDEFISAYRLMYHPLDLSDKPEQFQFYTVSRLIEDRDLNKPAIQTWQEKICSILTGARYADEHTTNYRATQLFQGTVGGALGAAAGIFAGAALGSIIPIFGTFLGGLFGGILGFMGGFFFAAIATQFTQVNGYHGIMGNWHFLRVQIHHFSEWIKARCGIIRECDVEPKLVISDQSMRIIKETQGHKARLNSTVRMTKGLGPEYTSDDLTTSAFNDDALGEPPKKSTKKDKANDHQNTNIRGPKS